jgi:hypothetical protein
LKQIKAAHCPGDYLRQAAQHFLGFWPDREAYKFVPVDVQTFVESKTFLDRQGVLYPAVMEELREDHLRRVLRAYAAYYNELRTHLSLDKDSPNRRRAQCRGNLASRPILGGLHHQYCRM